MVSGAVDLQWFMPAEWVKSLDLKFLPGTAGKTDWSTSRIFQRICHTEKKGHHFLAVSILDES